MSRKLRAWLCVGCGLMAVAGPAWAAERAGTLTTAQLLVDLARDHGLQMRGHQTPADVQHVRSLLRAAVRLDPALAEAYVWLYELAMLEGDETAAAHVLTGLLNAQPTHQGAFARWLAGGARTQQTMEERVRWLAAVAATKRPPGLEAMIHTALGRLALERMDSAEARRQAALARALEPASIDAALLALDVLEQDAEPAERLRAVLRVLQRTPLSVQLAWQAGSILDEYGFAEEAARFYDHALAVHEKANPHGPVPAGFLLALAQNLHARGQHEAAIDRTREAIAADPSSAAQAAMFLYYLLEHEAGGTGGQVRRQLAERFAHIREPADFPVNEVAQAAWFYGTIEPQTDRALMLARAAAERAPADAFVQRVLGWALAVNELSDQARQTLEPLAEHDPYAAFALATLARQAGDETAAQRFIERIDPRPASGPAALMLASWDAQAQVPTSQPQTQPTTMPTTIPTTAPATQPASQPTTQPAPQRAKREYPDIAQACADFDYRVLEFHRDPARFLEAQVELEDRSLTVGQPWWAVFKLTNRGPFPITLGPSAMANPVFLLSFAVEGDRKREYPALMTVSLDHVRVLYPGQSVQLRQTLDVGPLRRVARGAPQQLQRITMHALLDAVQYPDESWEPGPGGQRLRPVYFNRLPAGTGREAINALFSAVTGGSLPARVRALELMAQLVGERQQAEWKRLEYKPAPVPAERMESALLNLLGSDSWELRVRTLDALQVMGLDRQMFNAAEACLEHPHWLVRLMAVRLLARQGEAFAERAEAIAQNDADELVRAIAESQLAKLRP